MSQSQQSRGQRRLAKVTPLDAWSKRIDRNDKGAPKVTTSNVALILQNDEQWKGVLQWDMFRSSVRTSRVPSWDNPLMPSDAEPGEWSDNDDTLLSIWLTRNYGFSPRAPMCREAVVAVARANPVHPIREWLGGLAWDGQHRVDDWLTTYLGVERRLYASAVGRWFLMGALARVMQPGCKVDTMLILEGPQGRGKSTALRVMFGDEWFSDSPVDLESKDRFLALQGQWCVELAELDSMTRATSERIKSFLSSPVDTFRPPYGRSSVQVPRQCVIAGTTNAQAYLRDETGGRRFWPVRCGNIDLDGLRRDRDQIWAEVRELWDAGGERWWPSTNDAWMFTPQQEERRQEDVWEEPIAAYLDALVVKETSVNDIMHAVLEIDTAKRDQASQNRVSRALQVLGWERTRLRRDGRRQWLYVPSVPGTNAPSGDTSGDAKDH